jgi:hypothetical protein
MTDFQIALLIIAGVLIAIFMVSKNTDFSQQLFNKHIFASNIILSETPLSVGDIALKDDKIFIRFRWTTKAKNIKDITIVRAYELVDFGLENHNKYLEMIFINEDKVEFDENRLTHQEFIDLLLLKLNSSIINWTNEFPPLNDKEKRDILYSTE